MTAACPACVAAPTVSEIATTGPTVQFSVPSIRCAACIGTIERHFESVRGVVQARVNATQKRVTVHSSLPENELLAELRSIGYEAYLLDQKSLAKSNDRKSQDLLLRMGVAGFAMMNVMLLSVAVWSGATDATRDLFHLISAAIALPAVVFSAKPFFESATKALRVWRLNMDVPISLALVLAAGMSLYEALHGGEHAYFDAALSLTFFLLIGRFLEHRTRSAARSAASELAALEIHTAQRKVGTRIETVDVKELRIGDTVIVKSGMRIPVDGVLRNHACFTDRSFLTGESEPVQHDIGDELCAGEINLGATFELCATAIGHDTRLSRIAALVDTAENARNSFTSLADKAARIYAPVVHLLAAVSFLGWVAYDGDVRHALNVAIAVLIITCPCALGLAVPAVSTAAISRLYRMGFLVKSGTALERLAIISTIVFDKTGTLTRPGFCFDLSKLSDEEAEIAKGLANQSAHPLSQALATYLDRVDEAQITAVAEHLGAGITGLWNNIPVALGRASWLGCDGDNLTLMVDDKRIPLASVQDLLPGALGISRSLESLGIEAEIISGDSEGKTAAFAGHAGFKKWHGGASPEDKAKHVQMLAEQHPSCMVGDGINDTAALAYASVSIAPGSALDATRNAADIIMLGDILDKIPDLVLVARRSVWLSKQNFGIAILYNFVAVPIAIAGLATPLIAALAMSASSITVLLNALRVRL